MAAGFPVKANYVTGDILSAVNMNDLAGTLNYLDPTAKGDLFPASDGSTLTRLAVGANNTVLTADSATATGLKWASPGSSGALTLIGTYTPSGVSTYSLNSIFSSTYTNYRIVGEIDSASAGNMFIKMRLSGTDSSVNYYSLQSYWSIAASGDSTVRFSNSTSGLIIDSVNPGPNYVSFDIYNPFVATPTGMTQIGTQKVGGGYVRTGGGYHDVSTAYDGLSLVSGSNISGTFSVYGYGK